MNWIPTGKRHHSKERFVVKKVIFLIHLLIHTFFHREAKKPLFDFYRENTKNRTRRKGEREGFLVSLPFQENALLDYP